MPSPQPVRSPSDWPTVLVAGLSARALATAAARAGLRPLAADLFRDRDTRKQAWRSRQIAGSVTTGFEEASLIAGLDSLSAEAGGSSIGLVVGAGFEGRVDLLSTLDARYGLIGNGPKHIRRMNDPTSFFSLLDRLSIPHPEVAFRAPSSRGGWLIKREAASGGAHIEPLRSDTSVLGGSYYQRRVRGRAISALFLADRRRALVLGFSEQWAASAGPRTPFRFGGLAQPAEIAGSLAADLVAVIDRLVEQTGLVGLNSADFMVRRRNFDLLEINPRIGASLDIFDRAPGAPLFALHCRAHTGDLPESWSIPAGATASAVVYANRRLMVPRAYRWPAWSADRPDRGLIANRGDPLCSVFASDSSAANARATVAARARLILDAMGRPPRRRRMAVHSETTVQ